MTVKEYIHPKLYDLVTQPQLYGTAGEIEHECRRCQCQTMHVVIDEFAECLECLEVIG